MIRSGWRRFRPRRRQNTSLFDQVHNEIAQIVDDLQQAYGRKLRYQNLEDRIDELRQRAANGSALDTYTLLVMQAPRAVAAQIAMDTHAHGYHNRRERLFELIDFNDSFVEAVLVCPTDQLGTFSEQAKKEMDWLCHRLKAQSFSDRQYEAIDHGLSREIAVYRAAIKAGFSARMTSRRDDAFGIDMVIGDTITGRELNIDCKTSSSYFLRLQDLMRESRISKEEEARAERDGYVRVVNKGDGRRVEVTILRIDSKLLGPITNFSFEEPEAFEELLRRTFDN